MHYGVRIRRLREDAGMTQSDLADEIAKVHSGVNQSHVSQVERGAAGFRPETLATVAKALETSIDYLLSLTDDPTPYSDLREQVILVEKDPERREVIQKLFSAIEKLPPDMRDSYWETLHTLYDGVIARARKQRMDELRGRRPYMPPEDDL